MKRLLLTLSLVSFVTVGYVLVPFVTAWSIREAVRTGDSVYLESAIDWPRVRVSLAPTLGRWALDLPDDSVKAPAGEPSLWQRVKSYVGQNAISVAIDSYLTPEGLPQLFAVRKAYRDYIAGDPDANLSTLDRMKRTWARVKRAEFQSLTEVEVDMLDKHDESRMYVAKLELAGFGWKLTELRVQQVQPKAAGVAQLMSPPAPQLSN